MSAHSQQTAAKDDDGSTGVPSGLAPLGRLVGSWVTEMTHPASPGLVVHGTAVIEWLEGGEFAIQRSRADHPQFPASTSIIGFTGRDRIDGEQDARARAGGEAQLTMHYFDSRGVFRVYDVDIDEVSWRLSRNAEGFSQRFTGTFTAGGSRIDGIWQVCEDGAHWQDDLAITYRRRA